MTLTYAIGTTTFAALCSLVWLMTGGSALSAAGVYLVSGQVAMAALMARAALTYRTSTQRR